MTAFLLTNWKSIAAVCVSFAISLMLHKFDVQRIEFQHEMKIAAVKKAMAKQCAEAQAITEKVSHDYQNKITYLNSRLAAARRLHVGECVAVPSYASSRHDGAPKPGKPLRSPVAGTGTRTLSAQFLIDLTGEGEKYRLQLLACQQFVNMTKQ